MPKLLPDSLACYSFYGLNINHREHERDHVTECPFCGRDKFSISLKTAQWRCLVCNEGGTNGKSYKGGNPITFVRKLYDLSNRDLPLEDYSALSSQRKIQSRTFKAWGVVKSVITGQWLVPGFNIEGKLCQLYRYVNIKGKDGNYKPRLIAAPKPHFNQQIFGMNLWDDKKPFVYICEGPWDAMALWEVLSCLRATEDGFSLTKPHGNRCLLKKVNVIAVPGCNVFPEAWKPLVKGKAVTLLFDNDHAKKHPKTGDMIPPAAFEGVKRIAGLIAGTAKSVSYLRWGDEGFDPDLPSGTDVRDLLRASDSPVKGFQLLNDKFAPVPEEILSEAKEASKSKGMPESIPCESYEELVESWKRAMKWTEGLDHALSAMLASVASVRSVGDQLWLKIIGPASCLDGDTAIHDPVDGTTKTIRERTREGRRFNVWTMKETDKFGVAEALPPVEHEPTEIFEVLFKSGRRWKVTSGHEFWNGSSYVSVQSVSDALRQCSSYPVLTISGSALSTHGQDVLHSMKTLQGFQGSCCACSCLGDEQLPLGEDTALTFVPSLIGVQGCNPAKSGVDDLSGNERKCSPPVVQHDHLSNYRPCFRGESFSDVPQLGPLTESQPVLGSDDSFGCLTPEYYCTLTETYLIGTEKPTSLFETESNVLSKQSPAPAGSCKHEIDRLLDDGQFLSVCNPLDTDEHTDQSFSLSNLSSLQDEFRPHSIEGIEAQQPARLSEACNTQQLFSHSCKETQGDSVSQSTNQLSQPLEAPIIRCNETHNLLTLSVVDEIVKVTFLKRDHYYDFHVPETNNYWALGGFHHNCGKSTLCEALSVNTRYVLAKSTVRGFHSGFGEEDCSLISQVADKTLVTKDGDTLLQSPNLGQILSEARDVYDTVSRTSYRNKASRDYTGIRMTWLLCGTSSLRSIDSSELGERFLDCVIMEGIDDDMEDEILDRVARRAMRNMGVEAGKDGGSHYEEEMCTAMGKTGGYVTHLRKNASRLLAELKCSERAIRLCTRLGKYVAYMRARPSRHQTEKAEREFAARLVSQMIRLASTEAVVLNKSEIDEEVISRVHKIAMNTARGKTMEIVETILEAGNAIEMKGVSLGVNLSEAETRKLLRFLREIGVVNLVQRNPKAAVKTKPVWVVTARMKALWEEVHSWQDS